MKMLTLNRTYTTSTDKVYIDMLLWPFFSKIERTVVQDPHPGLIIASHHFCAPYLIVNETDLLSLAVMDLLMQYVYPSQLGYCKFTISLTVQVSHGELITFTLENAIPLTENGNLIKKSVIYSNIYALLLRYAEIYDGSTIQKAIVRAYLEKKMGDRPAQSIEERYSSLSSILKAGFSKSKPEEAKRISRSGKAKFYPEYITAIKKGSKERKPFIVSDLETILVNNIHKPYAAGLMMVHPGKMIEKDMIIHTYFSEDYKIFLGSFEERSTKVLIDLICMIEILVKQEKKAKTVYFHNLSRFDGIFLLKHLASHHSKYKLKPLMRNNRLYELSVYSGKVMLFRFRDSLNLLPGTLNNLAKSLCPDLGTKGSVDHKSLDVNNIAANKDQLLESMKTDILLLGGVMLKAQDIYWNLYKLDIESKITLSSLALNIFRLRYYDDKIFPIHIPNKNEDTFIRKAYYGGHTDAYKPYGENLYYYDVNSLYPYVMQKYPMPCGKPKWYSNLEDQDLDSMLGFIEAYVVCPKTIKKPFLPYRNKEGTLIFPTGEFIGVYYSEELKYAKGIGYKVYPISGYLFERKESPFKDFVSSLFSSRLEARKDGNEALSYVYKILMNSLYGRFGIHPKSTITEVCNLKRYNEVVEFDGFIHGDMLCDNNFIVSYHANTGKDGSYWNPPKNSAVQIAAAITANARIYMYPYISRDDCYYTDTDSIVLSQPLPSELISSSILGMFKLEAEIAKGLFLAPKSYYFDKKDGSQVKKFKGPGKDIVTPEWFEEQYEDPSRSVQVLVEANFRIDWLSLEIIKKDIFYKLGIKLGSKRIPVYDRNQKWVDTDPIDINDLSNIDYNSRKVIKSLSDRVILLENENLIKKLEERDREIAIVKSLKDVQTGVTNLTFVESTDEEIANTDMKTDEDNPNTDKKKPP